jgi:hypothetical protein
MKFAPDKHVFSFVSALVSSALATTTGAVIAALAPAILIPGLSPGTATA